MLCCMSDENPVSINNTEDLTEAQAGGYVKADIHRKCNTVLSNIRIRCKEARFWEESG